MPTKSALGVSGTGTGRSATNALRSKYPGKDSSARHARLPLGRAVR